MQCHSEAIFCCGAVAGFDFTAVLVEEGIKVVLTIRALLDSADPMFSCLGHKVILQELM